MKASCLPLLFLIAHVVSAQEVKSKSYQIMLNTLLSHSVPELSVAETDNNRKILWLDARAKDEFEVSRIAGARWVGYDDFSLDRVADLAKDREIIVYCSIGYRSEKVSELLIEAGYANVHNLYGGIFEWKNQGKDVVDSTYTVTEEVHAFSRLWGIWLTEGKKVY